MKMIVLLLSLSLFLLEWYVIRYTSVKFYIPILITFLIGLPVGLFYGLHLVAYPIIFVVFTSALCLIEKKYFNRKRMTEEEWSRLKDL
ncbi:MAG: hypothetical protein Q4A90_06890 [Streptococcus sp.]|nr:hypothetical protein [Streptococcus sp.]